MRCATTTTRVPWYGGDVVAVGERELMLERAVDLHHAHIESLVTTA
jgi:hypothetical protein